MFSNQGHQSRCFVVFNKIGNKLENERNGKARKNQTIQVNLNNRNVVITRK